jgi:hypothetical protein
MATERKKYYDDLDEDEEEVTGSGTAAQSEDYLKKLDEMLDKVEPLVMSINSSYNQYAAGVETRPPVERVSQLEQLMNSLVVLPKPTPAYRFRFQHAQGVYNTYKTRWTKLLEDVESGKIKRFAGPQRKKSG